MPLRPLYELKQANIENIKTPITNKKKSKKAELGI